LEKIHLEYEVAGREYGVALPVTAVVDQILLSMRQNGWGD
jgi:2-hydroxy-3-oxopropionate reductase